MATTGTGTGLARVILVTPWRRLALAIPEHLPLGVTLPALVSLARPGQPGAAQAGGAGHGPGWTLRRTDGSRLDLTTPPGPQAVIDGSVLHLVPPQCQWPEPQVENLVALGAAQHGGAGRRGRANAGTLAGVTMLLAALAVLFAEQGPPWAGACATMLTAAVLLVGIAAWRTRRGRPAAALTGLALAAGFAGGLGVVAGRLPVWRFAAPQLLTAAAAVTILAVAAHLGTRGTRWAPVAGMVAGGGGIVDAGLATAGLSATGAAAALATVLLVLMPAYPLLVVRLARVPMPAVPRTAAELLGAGQLPDQDATAARVAASVQLLGGALTGTAVLLAAAVCRLAATPGTATLLLAAVVSAGVLLRARAFVAATQRWPLLAAGTVGAAATALGAASLLPATTRLVVAAPLLVVAAGVVCAAGLRYSRQLASPYLGRAADLLDVLLTLAVGLLAASVLGLYQLVRGLGG